MTAQLAGRILTAIYSGALMLFGSLSVTLTGTQTFSDVTTQQWLLVGVWTLGAIGGTFGLAGWSGPRLNGLKPES